MSNPPPDVREVIDDLAERLLALSSGKQIPDDWMRYLLKRLAPKPKPRGRPLNLACLEGVAYETARRCFGNPTIVARTSPNKNDKEKARLVVPEQVKRRIAEQYGVDVRTITFMQRIVDTVLPEHPEHVAVPEKPARSVSDEERAVLDGTARAIGERGKLKDREELRRHKERLDNERRKLME